MNTLSLVDPAQRELVGALPLAELSTDTLPSARANTIEAFHQLLPPASAQREERTVPSLTDAPAVRVLIYRPERTPQAETLPAILYVHGGGLVTGNPDMLEPFTSQIARENDVLVVAVDYRLAPETPFPGPLEDCYAALAWLYDHARELGVDSSSITVMGDSAGGGLAAALALLARDRGEFPLKAQVLIYPMLDCRTGTSDAPVDNPTTGEFVWNRAMNRFGWESMRGGQTIPEARLGHFSPALAVDLARLPPTLVMVGTLDLFLEEDTAYVLRLSRAGVPVEAHLYPGGVHGFNLLPGPLADRFKVDLRAAINRLLKSESTV